MIFRQLCKSQIFATLVFFCALVGHVLCTNGSELQASSRFSTRNTAIQDGLQGRSIRVNFIRFEDGATLYKDENGNWAGMMWEIFDQIRKDAGFTYNETHITDATYAESPQSNYTGCVIDVGKGNIDLCVGDVWETPSRRLLASFTSPLWTDTMMLGVMEKQTTLADEFGRVFLPFSTELWILTLAAYIVLSILVAVLETYPNAIAESEDFETGGSALKNLAYSIHLGLLGFFSGGPSHAPARAPSRLVILGMGWLGLILISSYTANLASILTAQAKAGSYDSIDAITDAGGKMCGHDVLKDAFVSIAPKARWEFSSDFLDIATPVFEEKCLGMTMSSVTQSAFEAKSDQDKYKDFCNVMLVGAPLAGVPVALPVSSTIEATVSAWITQYRSAGKINEIMNRNLGSSQCTGSASSGDGEQITVAQMASTYIITAAFALTGVAWWGTNVYFSNKKRKQGLGDSKSEDKKSDANNDIELEDLSKGDIADKVKRLERVALTLVNEARSIRGLPPLSSDSPRDDRIGTQFHITKHLSDDAESIGPSASVSNGQQIPSDDPRWPGAQADKFFHQEGGDSSMYRHRPFNADSSREHAGRHPGPHFSNEGQHEYDDRRQGQRSQGVYEPKSMQVSDHQIPHSNSRSGYSGGNMHAHSSELPHRHAGGPHEYQQGGQGYDDGFSRPPAPKDRFSGDTFQSGRPPIAHAHPGEYSRQDLSQGMRPPQQGHGQYPGYQEQGQYPSYMHGMNGTASGHGEQRSEPYSYASSNRHGQAVPHSFRQQRSREEGVPDNAYHGKPIQQTENSTGGHQRMQQSASSIPSGYAPDGGRQSYSREDGNVPKGRNERSFDMQNQTKEQQVHAGAGAPQRMSQSTSNMYSASNVSRHSRGPPPLTQSGSGGPSTGMPKGEAVTRALPGLRGYFAGAPVPNSPGGNSHSSTNKTATC